VIGWRVPDTLSHGADPSTHVTIRGSSGLRRFFRYAMFIYSFNLCYSLSLYPFTERYAQPYFFSCLIRQTFPLVFRLFKTLCLLNYALMIRHDYDITSSLRRGALQLWYQSQRFERSSVPVLDRLMLVEIPHRSLFILGLNALTSKSPIPLRRRHLP
nr:hypothetical protein [Tanacetum cinerariifolium]GFB65168.1 hypothetical protein [Tanacetum cinerariifolium]